MYENIIFIPYREREQHLKYFIENTVPLIQCNLPNTRVVVIEQNEGKLFNRGAILNVGFKEYENKSKYFITNDVDINPTKKCIEEHYSKIINEKEVLGILVSPCNTLAPIIKIKDKNMQQINGFPNNIWGWGNEDKALQNRSEYYNIVKHIIFINNDKSLKNDYFICFNDIDDREKSNISNNYYKEYIQFKNLSDKEKEEMIMSSGLNNIEYKIIERKMIHDIVELIKVDI